MKTYKQKYEELKSSLDVNTKINTHTKNYIHKSLNLKAIGRFLTFIASVLLAVFNFGILISNWKLLHIGELFKSTEEINTALIGLYQLGIVPQFILQYCLIGLIFICLTAMIKGGFKKIKSYKDTGIIFGLIYGLIFGLTVGLIAAIIGGLTAAKIYGLTGGLIAAIIYGLTVGLTAGIIFELIFVSIYALIGEFDKD